MIGVERKRWVLAAALLIAVAGRADQVALKNGDRITGAIIKIDGKTLTLKAEALGTVTVGWDDVVAIQSDGPLNVVLADGKTIQATIQSSQGRIELKEPRQTLAAADIVAIRNAEEQAAYERLLDPPFTRLWAGTATVGFAGTQGNAETRTFTVALNASRVTRNDKTTVHFSAVKASALIGGVNADTAQAVRGG